jgi:hypothetical protein
MLRRSVGCYARRLRQSYVLDNQRARLDFLDHPRTHYCLYPGTIQLEYLLTYCINKMPFLFCVDQFRLLCAHHLGSPIKTAIFRFS